MNTFALFTLAGVLSLAAPTDDAVKQDPAPLQSTWKLVSVEHGGKKVDFRPSFLHIRGERLLYASKAVTDFPTDAGQKFTIHPDTSPSGIDIEEQAIRATGKTVTRLVEGIYQVEGDTLKLLLSRTGQRPKSFEAVSHADLWVYQRQAEEKAGKAGPEDK